MISTLLPRSAVGGKSAGLRCGLYQRALCLLAVVFPGADLQCWDSSGNQAGTWSETSCDRNSYSGTWTGYATNDCRFIGTNEWGSVNGTISPSTNILTATGTIRDECGYITMTGTFSRDLVSIAGTYKYSKGGTGSFIGAFNAPKYILSRINLKFIS